MSKQRLIVFILSFFALWAAAWVLHNWLVSLGLWSADNSSAELAYWAMMKFLVWIVYPWFFWRKNIENIRDFIGLSPSTIKRGYRWGSIATIVWVVLTLASALWLQHQHLVSVCNWATYIYVITLTPIAEEIMFRGFILSGLQALKMDGKPANVLTTVLFLLVHCLGWAFQGVLLANLGSTIWVGIALFSLVAGFIRIHSGSLRASILLHMGNNALSGVLGSK